jgi:membrane protease YdiL (CAAX protease family)
MNDLQDQSEFRHTEHDLQLHPGSSKSVVAFALIFPTIVTWIYFVALREQPPAFQQGAYVVSKTIQFSFPLIWVFLFQRQLLQRPQFTSRGIGPGIVIGLVIGAAMLSLYSLVLRPSGFFVGPGEAMREKITGLGLTAVWKYAGVSVFYALCHSLLEEYYWRWFVFRQLKQLTPLAVAIVISSLGFMSHHVLVLATYFGWDSPATWLFSSAVAVGGAMWAALYHRSQSLLAPWVSHCLVDAAIFILGFDLARSVFAG